jgi:hypothetical protein
MKYVAITKTYADVPRTKENAYLPDTWPAECEEFESLELALKAYPEKQILSVADYTYYSKGLQQAHDVLSKPKRPWWKLWGKA